MLPPLRPDLIPRTRGSTVSTSGTNDREARLRAEEQKLEDAREEFEAERSAYLEQTARQIGVDRDRHQVVSNPAGVAQLISAAGAKARTGASNIEWPADLRAKAIAIAGARARSEQIDPRDQAWFENYCRRLSASRSE